mmetsp:Transcript_2135/g.6798  ORF Transcript_2135/g.6798 Transcript_2135/m.6798 type:complete len:107 (+) Transcript_2135:436-756(+)
MHRKRRAQRPPPKMQQKRRTTTLRAVARGEYFSSLQTSPPARLTPSSRFGEFNFKNKGIVKTATACECEKTLKIRQKQHKKRNIILKSALRVALLELLPFTTLRER